MKLDRRIVLELLIGLAPVTFLLVPLLMAGANGILFAMLAILFDQQQPLQTRFHLILSVSVFLVWVIAAVAGVGALWMLVLAGPATLSRPLVRVCLLICLLLGLVAELRWFYFMLATRDYDLTTWVVWLALLGPPSLVGLTRAPALLLLPKK